MSMELTETILCQVCDRPADLSREHVDDGCEDVVLCSECECIYCGCASSTPEELRLIAHHAVKQVVNFREAIRNPVIVFTIHSVSRELRYTSSDDRRLFIAAPIFECPVITEQIIPALRDRLKQASWSAYSTEMPQHLEVGTWTMDVVPFRDDQYDLYIATLFTCSDSQGRDNNAF